MVSAELLFSLVSPTPFCGSTITPLPRLVSTPVFVGVITTVIVAVAVPPIEERHPFVKVIPFTSGTAIYPFVPVVLLKINGTPVG